MTGHRKATTTKTMASDRKRTASTPKEKQRTVSGFPAGCACGDSMESLYRPRRSVSEKAPLYQHVSEKGPLYQHTETTGQGHYCYLCRDRLVGDD